MYHKSILVKNIIDSFNLIGNEIVIDCTTGEGGHSLHFAQKLKNGELICIDRDEAILNIAKDNLKSYENVKFVNENFKNINQILQNLNIEKVDRILIDLGISVFHYKNANRGFSFSKNEKLDMRLDKKCEYSAFEIVNTFSEKELASIFYKYGEESFSKRIVKSIIEQRKTNEIKNSEELANIIYYSIPKKFHPKNIHPATKVFQALRIFVNDELTQLDKAISDCIEKLNLNGIIAIISFHSLEDRIVKNTFNKFIGKCTCPPMFPECRCNPKRILKILTKKPIIADEKEIKYNPSSRSAKLRIAKKVSE